MTSTAGCGTLVGRHREKALLGRALDDARTGTGGSAVLLRGEPGIGKTALLEWTEARARALGFTVLRAVGSEAEAELAFGALHQALWPLLERSEVLSARQREALECALGLRGGLPPNGFTVGASALALLAEAARDRPQLLLIDDLHWVDSSSATVFAFLHRRLTELPLVIVGASRPDPAATEGWPALPVDIGALPPADAGALLRQRHPELAATTADRVLEEAAGNPLALVELPRHLHEDQLKGIVPLPDGLPLGQRLERLFAGRLRALSGPAARTLLLAALGGTTADATGVTDLTGVTDDTSGIGGVWAHTGGEEAPASAAEALLDEIEASGLARLDATGRRLVFRHPLVRAAVLSTARRSELHAAHRQLAACLDADDPRRLVHEASAALVPDEDLAARLQDAGGRIARRGGAAEGALLLDRAAALSTDPAARARRLTWAAVMAAHGGRLRYTARLVEELRRGPVPPDAAPLFAYATVYVDQGHRVDFASSFTLLPEALDALTAPATGSGTQSDSDSGPGSGTAPDTDIDSDSAPDADSDADSRDGLAEQVCFKLLLAATYTDDDRAWQALESHLDDMSPLARLCHRAWSDPARTAQGVSEELKALVAEMSEEQEAGGAWLLLWTASAVDLADDDLWRRFTGQHSYATQGSIAKARSYQDFLRGRWDAAGDCLREAEVAEQLGYHCNALLFRLAYAHFAAGRGDEDELRAMDALIRPVAVRARMRYATDRLTYLNALAALAHGRHEDAYCDLVSLTPPGVLPRGLPWFHLPFLDFVDAAAHTGRRDEARAHVAAGRAARMAEISAHHAFLLAAATALAAPDEEADAAYRAAYAVPGADQWVFELARLRLAHGSWLRRHRRAEAHDTLREAHRAFQGLRARPWEERCARELRAAGHAVGPAADGHALLTGQELRIAELAATGLTNKEIGQRLRLSPRTVAAHLYKIFPKLGITTRAALAQALRQD
ncbi:helix-turn-helix transcriptional regulator [Streptomyces huiliensis]|uniref:helix-turn-helix transcriptional regulator n=1 Tax=Streptomyces huiliensis TaxID=2876027 RepID=UPI001CBE4DDE|nr:LuxR family transcriptional regulator [Streptomyces huiliensis]